MKDERDIRQFESLSPRSDRGDIYYYENSTEKSDPITARLARQTHAAGYLDEGFIYETAIGNDGQITPDIDKARGENVEYYVGFAKGGEPISTLRKISTKEGEGVESLPGYQLCADYLSDEGQLALLEKELEGRPIVEISSFGHVPETTPLAGLELLRNVLQESYGTNEVWFFTMVTEKYKTLVNMFGPRVVRRIGEEVSIVDERVNNIALTPVLFDTTSFFDNIKEGAIDEVANVRKRKRYIGSLRYFARGLSNDSLSEGVLSLLDEAPSFDFSTYIQNKPVQKEHEEWVQPLQLDLHNHVDALYAKRLVDDGKVDTVLDPPWRKEFSTMYSANDPEHTGSWFYYPWNKTLTHFPDKTRYRDMRHTRDRHLVTSDEQAQLYENSALFAGLSVGSHVLQHMVYAGVGESHVLADPDTISVSNLNRIHVGMGQVGEYKVDTAAKRVSELDPYMELEVVREGVTESSLASLETIPDIIFDEVDDFATKALLRMYAQKNKIPLIMATDVGYKTIIDVERYDMEEPDPFNGRLNHMSIEELLRGELTQEQRMKITTKLIGLGNASFRLLESVTDPTLEGFPQLGVTASQGGALATIVARDILLGRPVLSGRRVHDARRAMKLRSEVPLSEGLKSLQKFIAKR